MGYSMTGYSPGFRFTGFEGQDWRPSIIDKYLESVKEASTFCVFDLLFFVDGPIVVCYLPFLGGIIIFKGYGDIRAGPAIWVLISV
jgi:hypothetical protein